MASSYPNDKFLVENKGIGGRILDATYNHEVNLIDTDAEAVSDNLDSEKLCVTRLGLPICSSIENNLEKKLASKMCDLNLGLNKTFDANRERSEVNEARKTVVLDETLNKFTAKLKNQSIISDSEDSLGIINDVLGNCSFDLLDQFKCPAKSRENLIKKSSDINFLTFSPLATGVLVSENGSPMMCRFTSTPEPSSSVPPLKEPSLDKWYEDFKKGNIMASTSKVPLLNDLLETATNTTIEEIGSPILSATFNITPEPLGKVSSPLHVDAASKNKTFTLDEENKVNASSAENNGPKVIRDSSLPVLGMGEGKQRQNDRHYIENKKLRSEALLKAMPIQKCNPPEIQSRLNSTHYMTSKSSSTTKLNRRYSFGISESSKIRSLKKPNQIKSNHFYNSNEPKLPEKKTAITLVPRKKTSIGTTAGSLTKPKQIIKSSFSALAVKPQGLSLDEKTKGKVSLEHTFTKGDGIKCALSPIVEKEGSLEREEKGTLSMAVTQTGNADTSMPSEHGTSSDKGVGKTAVLNEGLGVSKMQCATKPKVFSKNELLSAKKPQTILLESQSSNLNVKFKLTETIKDRHHSRLPVFGSIMPKNPPQRAFPNQCARTSSTKPVLRPPKIYSSKENVKIEVPIVSENSSCHEKATLRIPSLLKKQASKTYAR